MESLSYILSFLGLACVVSSSLLKGKRMGGILFLLFSGNALVGISYLLVGSFSGAASLFVGATQALVNYCFARKQKGIPTWLVVVYVAAFIVANLCTFTELVDFLALIASLTFVMCIDQKNGKKYRIWTIVNIGLWVLYDALKPAYPALMTHIPFLIFTIAGMLIHDRKEKKNS